MSQQSSGVGFVMACTISAAITLFAGFLYWQLAPGQSSKVVVLDSNRIVGQQLDVLMAQPTTTPEVAAQQGKAFATAIDAVVQQYKDSGYVVINRAVVIAYPDALDVTEDVAKAVGIELKPVAK